MAEDVSRRAVLGVLALAGTAPRATTTGLKSNPLQDRVLLRDYGADPSGATSSVAAFAAAMAAGKCVMGAPGDVYLLDASVIVPAGREIRGNGATPQPFSFFGPRPRYRPGHLGK